MAGCGNDGRGEWCGGRQRRALRLATTRATYQYLARWHALHVSLAFRPHAAQIVLLSFGAINSHWFRSVRSTQLRSSGKCSCLSRLTLSPLVAPGSSVAPPSTSFLKHVVGECLSCAAGLRSATQQTESAVMPLLRSAFGSAPQSRSASIACVEGGRGGGGRRTTLGGRTRRAPHHTTFSPTSGQMSWAATKIGVEPSLLVPFTLQLFPCR